jgi:hypothetical protein
MLSAQGQSKTSDSVQSLGMVVVRRGPKPIWSTGKQRAQDRLLLGPMRNWPRKVAFHERYQYFLRSAYRPLYDHSAPLDAQAETTGRGVWITEDVSVLRIDYVSIKGNLFGVWQALYSGGVLDFKEMSCRLIRSENFSTKGD